MSHDPRCADLARIFLDDAHQTTPVRIAQLADDIQAVIEDYLGSLPTPPAEGEGR
jgi:hypothetical protein